MQTKLHTLSGRVFRRHYAKFIFIGAVSFSILMLLRSGVDSHEKKCSPVAKAKKDFASNVKKLFGQFNQANIPLARHGISHSLVAPVDTNQLKKSDWFSTVKKDIQKRMYYIDADKKTNTFKSLNYSQGLTAVYGADQFSLQSAVLNDKDHQVNNDWQLNIAVTGLYEDGKLLEQKNKGLVHVSSDENNVEYNFGTTYTIQYQNDPSGIRQNFIVKEKPSSNVQQLTVSLQAQGDWIVNKVHNTELHFAKRKGRNGLENKIIYNDLKAWDASGKALTARMEVNDDHNFEIIADVSRAVYPVTIDPLSSTPSSTLNGSGVNSLFGGSIAGAGDVNGDGYSDVIVGAPETSGFTGAAYIYLGSASGLSVSAAATLAGVNPGDNFGISVAGIGDINGDGYGDVIVGASGVSASAGAAYIFTGSATGIANNATPTAILNGISPNDNFGFSVAHAGDINGDGYSDVIIGAYKVSNVGAAYIYTGSVAGITTGASPAATLNGVAANDAFGISVASAGDINGDGYADIIIGAYGHSFAAGAAYIFIGSNTGIANGASPTATLNGAVATDAFGGSVASAGDVNGDGYSDVIIGASGVAGNKGAAYIFNGSGSGIANNASATTTLSGTNAGDRFGFSVSGAGDMNGDGYSDVIIGAIGVSAGTGAAYIFEGLAAGISNGATAALTLNGGNTGDSYGFSVGSVGDVNGDGISDAFVGAPNTTTATGNTYVYNGNPDASVNTSTLTVLGTSNGGSQEDRLGFSVSSAGDLNGDGYSDVVIGVIGYNGIVGAAYVYYGSNTGLIVSGPGVPTILTITHTSGPSENFGWSVAGAGDVNGDGYDDLVIGARYQNDNGYAYVFLGGAAGINTTPSTTLIGTNPFDWFGTSVASAGDVNGDGYYDIIIGASNAGVAYIYMGSASGIVTTSADTLFGPTVFDGFGISVASAGDINGDGYSDVIVGSSNGHAYVFLGSSTGIANNASANFVLSGVGGDFGLSVSSAGDVNGDGYSDVIVGAPNVNNYIVSAGAASLFLGGPGGFLSTTAATVLSGTNPTDRFGASVSSAGDVNGDGYSDVIVRATQASSNAGPTTGAAYLYLGGSSGLSSIPATSFLDEGSTDANVEGTNLRRSVASAGDVNGDGYSDVLVGVYEDNTNGFKAGAAHVYYGNNALGNNASNLLRLYETDLTHPIAADNLQVPNFGLGLTAKSPFGSVKGRLVWEVEPNGAPFQSGSSSTITNSVAVSGRQASYTSISPLVGTEFKSLIAKTTALATKVRARIQYAPTAVTFGQVYSPWVYSQVYLQGNTSGILPLDLLSFTANTSGQNILLNWKTSAEVSLKNYTVMHSLNAASAFDSIGQVAATGNSVSISNYQFTHFKPGAGVHYYRLKEVDMDGHFSYSPIVSAKINASGTEINIYPNPASDHIVITYQGITANYVRIMNAAGSMVGQYSLNPNSGQTTISLNGLARGNYFVEIVNSGLIPKQITVQ